jgi:hypothetical protein
MAKPIGSKHRFGRDLVRTREEQVEIPEIGCARRDGTPGRRRIICGARKEQEVHGSMRKRINGEGIVLDARPIADSLLGLECDVLAEFVEQDLDNPCEPIMDYITQRIHEVVHALQDFDLEKSQEFAKTLSGRGFNEFLRANLRLDLYREGGDKDLPDLKKILLRVQEDALRVLNVKVPEDTEAFQAWKNRMTMVNSLDSDALTTMGGFMIGKQFYLRDLFKEVKRVRKERFHKDSLTKSLGKMSRVDDDGDFGVCLDGGVAGNYLYSLGLGGECDGVDGEADPVMTWLNSFHTRVDKDGGGREIKFLRGVSACEERTPLTYEQCAELGGCRDQENWKEVISQVIDRAINRVEGVWAKKFEKVKHDRGDRSMKDVLEELASKDYTVRRTRHGRDGNKRLITVELVNRWEAMNEWIEMMAGRGVLGDVLWKMFEFKLGTEFTKYELAYFLSRGGRELSEKQVGDSLSRGARSAPIASTSKGTMFEVASRYGKVNKKRSDGKPIFNAHHYSIRP